MNYFSQGNVLLLIIGLMKVHYLFSADQEKRNTPCKHLTEWYTWIKNGFNKEPIENLFPHECEQQKAIYKSIVEKKFGSPQEEYYCRLRSLCEGGGYTCAGAFLNSAADITFNTVPSADVSSCALLGAVASACFIGAKYHERAYIETVIKRHKNLLPATDAELITAGIKKNE